MSLDCQEMNSIDVGYQYAIEHNLLKAHGKKPNLAQIVSKRT